MYNLYTKWMNLLLAKATYRDFSKVYWTLMKNSLILFGHNRYVVDIGTHTHTHTYSMLVLYDDEIYFAFVQN